MSGKKIEFKNTNEVLAKYYKSTCMKLYTLVVIESATIIVLFVLWILDTNTCPH